MDRGERFYNQIKGEYECPQGFDNVHGSCKITRDLTKVGSVRVPSVENAAGCRRVNGSWNFKHGVCIIHDTEDVGWTAPIKGAYFAWWQGTGVVAWKLGNADWEKKHGKSIEKIWESNEYPIHMNKYGEVTGCHVYSDAFYVDNLGMGMCESKFFTRAGKFKAREHALELASDVLQGKAQKHNLLYFDEQGRRISMDRSDAMVSDSPGPVIQMHRELKRFPAFEKKAAFQVRGS